MPTLPQVSKTVFEEALLLDEESARQRWLSWRAQIETDDLDGHAVLLLPLLSARLARWAAMDEGQHPDHARLAGICKRGWAQNQTRLRGLARVWMLLEKGGIEPLAVSGGAAWASLYEREQSLRPVTSVELLVLRSDTLKAQRLLIEGGWRPAENMPAPEGRALDQFRGLWFYDAAELPLHLAWRLRDLPPDLATEDQTAPLQRACEIGGTLCKVVGAEELLLDALTRRKDETVSWQCDALVLLRNESIEWTRVQQMLLGFPDGTARLQQLSEEHGIKVPGFVFEVPRRGYVHRRLSVLWVDSRQVAWKDGQTHTPARFLRYAFWRLAHGFFIRRGDTTPAVTVIDASGGTESSRIAEYGSYRTLFVFLAMRDVRLRYKRTWRGVLWALIQPLLPMLIFVAIFSRVIRPELPAGPYWLFVLAGLATWNFFSNAVNYASVTFVSNLNLVNKVYFPRAILPLAAVAACVVDLLVATAVLLPICFWEGARPGFSILVLPLVLLWAATLAAMVGTAAASLNVLHRDLKPLIPFLVQVWMYATPVLYPLAMVPRRWRLLAWLNPMTGVVESFRAAVLHTPWNAPGMILSLVSCGVVAAAALMLFLKVEADIAERV